VRVRLAQRPNGSTAWVRSGDVTLSRTAYRIVIGLDRRRLTLYRQGRRVFSAPAGVGTRAHPTPPGHFFVAFFEHLPGYGPFIMVTSAHSNTIHDWAGSHDAVVGIHGPLGDGAAIGAAGARVSHGCVRLRDGALLRLRRVPPGTPIDIRHAVRRNSVSGSQL
jgi:lipoprotein-anchoring transpeptidase ErfK/SrfK